MSKESINCKTKKITLFQFTSFSKHFGEGEVLASMNYDEIKKSDNSVSYVGPKDTITRFYYNYVCKQKWKSHYFSQSITTVLDYPFIEK